MPVFTIDKPIELERPVIVVEGTLPVGRRRFELVVVGESGKRSAPAEITVVVKPLIITPTGPPIFDPPIGGPVIPPTG
jgi:hypothetical protein